MLGDNAHGDGPKIGWQQRLTPLTVPAKASRGAGLRRSVFLYNDRNITCADCGQQFAFTASEQQFYADRGFSEPRRCTSCRASRKAARGDAGGAGNGGGG